MLVVHCDSFAATGASVIAKNEVLTANATSTTSQRGARKNDPPARLLADRLTSAALAGLRLVFIVPSTFSSTTHSGILSNVGYTHEM